MFFDILQRYILPSNKAIILMKIYKFAAQNIDL